MAVFLPVKTDTRPSPRLSSLRPSRCLIRSTSKCWRLIALKSVRLPVLPSRR